MGQRLKQVDGEVSESLWNDRKMAELPVSHEMTLEHMKERKGSS